MRAPRTARSDPTTSGGLFVGPSQRRRPLRLKQPPTAVPSSRQRLDQAFAALLLATMVLLCALCWGPIPLAALWVGSQLEYLSGSLMGGLVAAIACVAAALYSTLAVLLRLDHLWVLVRRAGGHPQQEGVLARLFALGAVVGGGAFAVWFLVIHGPGPTFFSSAGSGL